MIPPPIFVLSLLSLLSLLTVHAVEVDVSSLAIDATTLNNDYPVILMHGFVGWGRDELLGFKYWGGLYGDVEQNLQKAGFQVHTVAMGPVSSNWDRVCEAFAQIRGGQTDYGLNHSSTYAHTRFGRNYTALYPEWGSVDASGAIKKVHLLAHSMGGQDARLLAHLLIHGSPSEQSTSASTTISPLFQGGKHWIASISTVSTPHDGTTLGTIINEFIPFIVDVVAAFAVLAGSGGDTLAHIYDLKLDQFGLIQREGETLSEYLKRATSSSVFAPGFKDISLYDLSVEGAVTHNGDWVCEPDIFYFSYTTEATYQVPIVGNYLPDAWMFAVFWPFATFMGAYSSPSPGLPYPGLDSSWYQNDGVVNSRSQSAPQFNTNCKSTNVDAKTTKFVALQGQFFHLGVQTGWDHATIIGAGLHNVQPFYLNHVSMLANLSTSSSSSPVTMLPLIGSDDEDDVSMMPPAYMCSQAQGAYDRMCVQQTYNNMTFSQETCEAIESNVNVVCANVTHA